MQCVKPKTAIIYMETPLFLIHMSNEIIKKFKEHMTSEAEVCYYLLFIINKLCIYSLQQLNEYKSTLQK